MEKTKCPSSTPSTQLFAAKLYDGDIIIFDKELNIQQKVNSISISIFASALNNLRE